MPPGISFATIAPVFDEFAIKTEATFTDNQGSQFDRTPSPSDDIRIYAALGFTLNASAQLPVQRDAQGNPRRDSAGKLIAVDRAIAVSPNYHTANVPNLEYSNLLPPKVISDQTIAIPSFEALRQQALADWIPAGSSPQTFRSQPLNTAADWQRVFPAGGSSTQPTIVRVIDGGLTIPADVNLRNIVILVEQGNVQFNGQVADLDRVLLITTQGTITGNRLNLRETSLLAANGLNFNQSVRCEGFVELISGSSLMINQPLQTLKDTDNLWIIAQGDIVANAAITVRSAILSGGAVTINQPSTIQGYLYAKRDIRFNAKVNFSPANIQFRDTIAPVITAQLLRDTAVTGTNSDRITSDPTVIGQVQDSSRVVEFRGGLDQMTPSQFVDLRSLLQADGTFTLGRDRLSAMQGSLTEGPHTLHLQAKDSAGNQSPVFDFAFTLDSLAPKITLTESIEVLRDRARLIGTVDGTGSAIVSVTYRFDINPDVKIDHVSGVFNQAINFTGLNNGPHVLTLSAVDVAGNILTQIHNVTIDLDRTAPVIVANLVKDTAPNGTLNNDRLTFDPSLAGQISDRSQITRFQARFGDRPFQSILAQRQPDGRFELSRSQLEALFGRAIPDGVQTVDLQAEDEFGNRSGVFSLQFTLDTIAPVLTVQLRRDTAVTGVNGDRITADPTLIGQVVDVNRVAEFRGGLDGMAPAQFVDLRSHLQPDGSFTLQRDPLAAITGSLSEGAHTLHLQVIDAAGNASPIVDFAFTLDSLPPQITLSEPVDVLRDRARFVGTVDGTGSAIVALTYQFDNRSAIELIHTAGAFNQAIDFTGLDNGPHTLTFSAIDVAGNILTQTKAVTVDLDHTAPVIVANLVRDTAPDDTVNSDRLTFDPRITGKVSDRSQITRFQARFGDRPFTSILLERQIDGQFLLEKSDLETLQGGPIPDGLHTLELQAEDEFGNLSEVFGLQFTLDTQTPIPTLSLAAASDTGISQSDRITQTQTPILQGTAEPNAQIRLVEGTRLLGETIADAAGVWQITSALLNQGIHLLRAIAIDAAGNRAATPELLIKVDVLAPEIILTTPTNAPLKRESRLTGIVDGTGSAVTDLRYRINQGVSIPIPLVATGDTTGQFDEAFNWNGLTNGIHDITISATDVAGNQRLLTRTITLALNAAPVITSQAPVYFPLTQGIYLYPVQVSDADQDPLTYQLPIAPQGATISPTGEIRWMPDATVKAGDRVDFTVVVSDGHGGQAQQSFTVDVLAQLGTISGLVWNDANRNTVLDHVFVQGKNPVVVFVVDISGSTGNSVVNWSTATIEQVHSTSLSILDMEKAAIVALAQQMIQQGRTDIRFGMVLFDSRGVTVDLNPVEAGPQSLITVTADADRNTVPDLIQALTFRSAGSTNFTAGLLEAEKIFTANNVLGTDANIIFLSDGVGQLDVTIVQRLKQKGVNLKAFGIQAGAQMNVLQQIDPQATRLLTAREITNIFSSRDDRFQAERGIAGVRVYLDDNNNGVFESQEISQLSAIDDPTTLASETGRFRFTDLLPGTYTVRIVLPTGQVLTTPLNNQFVDTVTAAGESFSHLFGVAIAP